MSLVELVESWNFKNKSRILELIELNTSKIECAIAENMMLLKELTPFTPGREEPEDLEDAKELHLESSLELPPSAVDSASKKRGPAGIFAFGGGKLGFNAGISIAILILGQCKTLTRNYCSLMLTMPRCFSGGDILSIIWFSSDLYVEINLQLDAGLSVRRQCHLNH